MRGRGLSGVEVWVVGREGEQQIANAIIDAGETALGVSWLTEQQFSIVTRSGQVTVWDLNDNEPSAVESRSLELKTTLTAFVERDGLIGLGDEEGRVWILRSEDNIWSIGRVDGHTDVVDALAISHDGKRLASAGRDRSIAVWDTYLPAAEELGPSQSEVLEFFSVAFDAVQHPIISSEPSASDITAEREVYPEAEPDAYDEQGEDPTKDFAAEGISREDVLDFFSIAQDGGELEAAPVPTPSEASEGSMKEPSAPVADVVASDIADSEAELDDKPKSAPSHAEFIPKRRASEPEMITFQNIERFSGSEGWAIALAFSPQGDFLASGGMDNGIYLWDLDPQKEDLVAVQYAHSGWVCALEFSPDQTFIATGSWDTTVGVFDAKTLEPKFAFDFHRDYVVDLLFMGPTTLYTASYDGSVGQWDLEDQSLVRLLDGHTDWVEAIEAMPDKHLLSISSDGTVALWDDTSDEVLWRGGKNAGGEFRLGENVNLYDYVEERSRPEYRASEAFSTPESTARFRDFRSSGFGQKSSGKTAMSLLDDALEVKPESSAAALLSEVEELNELKKSASSFVDDVETKLAPDVEASSFANDDETKLAPDIEASSFANEDETKLARNLPLSSQVALSEVDEVSAAAETPSSFADEQETKLASEVSASTSFSDAKEEATRVASVEGVEEDSEDEFEAPETKKTPTIDEPSTAKIPSLQKLADFTSEVSKQVAIAKPNPFLRREADIETQPANQLGAFDSEIATGFQRDLATRGVSVDTSKVPVIPSEVSESIVNEIEPDENIRETAEGPAPELPVEEDLRVTAEVTMEELRQSLATPPPIPQDDVSDVRESEAELLAEEIRNDIETISDAFERQSESSEISEFDDFDGPRALQPDDVPSEVLDAMIEQAAGIDESVHDAWATLAHPSESIADEISELETAESPRTDLASSASEVFRDEDDEFDDGRFAAPHMSEGVALDTIPESVPTNPGLRTSGLFDRVGQDTGEKLSPFKRTSTEKSVPDLDGRPPTDPSSVVDDEFETNDAGTDPSRPTIDGQPSEVEDDVADNTYFPFPKSDDESAQESEASFIEEIPPPPKRTPQVLPAIDRTRRVDDLVELLNQQENEIGDEVTASNHGTSRINEPQIPTDPSESLSEVSEASAAVIWSARDTSKSPKMGIVRKQKPISTEYDPYFTIRTPHQWVYGLAMSHDGSMIASCGGDSSLCIWETTGGLKYKIKAPQNGLNSVVFSYDDRMVCAAGDDGHIHIWLLPEGDAERVRHTELPGHDVWVTNLDISADTKFLVSAGYDGSARVWELSTGECLRVLKGHTGPVTDIAMGTKTYTSGADGTIRVWNESWTLIDQYQGFDKLTGVCAHGSNVTFTAANGDVYALHGGQLIPLQRHRGEARSCEVRGDGVVVTVGEDGLVMLYTPETDAPYAILNVGVALWSVAFNQTYLACGGDDGRIHIFRKK